MRSGVTPPYGQDAAQGDAMDDIELLSYIEGELSEARSYSESVSEERIRNLNYYFRRPFGNEQPGRSQVVTSDVADVVDFIVPSLLKIYTSTDKVVEFSARTKEDVEGADQTTMACNYVFYTQNSGFLLLHDNFKDACLSKQGIFKVWWDKSKTVKESIYEQIGQDQIDFLQRDPNVEILAIEPADQDVDDYADMSGVGGEIGQMPQPQHFNVKVRIRAEHGQIKIECVPPEELFVSPNARSANIQDAPFVCHETRKTRQQLIADGYSYEVVMSLTNGSEEGRGYEERTLRRGDDSLAITDVAENEVWVQECYFSFDSDGDGVEELRKVCKVGGTILANEIIDEIPLYSWSPKPMPHTYIGDCSADDAVDTQEQKSSILRQIFDSLYQSNVPRWQVAKGRVDLDDLLTARPGSIVRMDNIGDAQPLLTPFVGQQAFPMIEYLDSEREQRTGVTRYNQGLDANSLNKTATGINIISSMSQQKIDFYARVFGELCLKPMFRGIMRLLAKHQIEPLSFRLNNNYVSIDPSAWNNEYDMTINVGLGTGNKDQQLMHLSQINQLQGQLSASPFGQMLIKPKQVYNVVAKIAENAGFKDSGQFWTDPGEQMPPPPPPNPQMIKDQAEHQLAQLKETHRHSERMIELRLEMAKLGMPMQVMQELGMPDPIGLGLPQGAQAPMNGATQSPMAPPNMAMPPPPQSM